MTISQYIASGERRQIIRTIEMTVGQKQAVAFAKHLLPGGSNGEMQQHLIDFAITVTADGDNPLRDAVQPLGDLRRRIPFRQRVARPVIEHIAEDNQPLRPALREAFQNAFGRRQRAVNIGCEHQFHINPLPDNTVCL